MPRESAASLGVVPAVPVPRPAPPPHLPPDEVAIWNEIVHGLPPAWLPVGSLPMLEIFCSSVVAMRHMRAIMLAEVEGSPRHVEASKAYRSEAAMVVKVGKLLRIGPRHDRTKLRAIPNLPRPWDLGGGAPVVNTFSGWGSTTAKEKPGGDEPPDVA